MTAAHSPSTRPSLVRTVRAPAADMASAAAAATAGAASNGEALHWPSPGKSRGGFAKRRSLLFINDRFAATTPMLDQGTLTTGIPMHVLTSTKILEPRIAQLSYEGFLAKLSPKDRVNA